MKKSLVALAVLGAFAGVASAQSNVTLFGIADINVQRISGTNNGSITRMHEGGVQTSRFGFKGEEDLGGGLKASFHLEGQFAPDTGALAGPASADNVTTTTSTAIFGRRSTISLSGANWGEVRLGRDYLPDYLLLSGFSAFGINGSAGTVAQTCVGLGLPTTTSAGACLTGTRASNAVQYFLPSNLGGFYGSLMYAFGEQASSTAGVSNPSKNDGRVVAGRVGIKVAALDATVATSKTTYLASATNGDLKRTNIGASYTIGAFKPMLFWNSLKVDTTPTAVERKDWGLGLVATFGQNVVRATYHNYDVKNSENDAKLLGVGYLYNMSKRTSLYANYGRMDNDGAGVAFTTAGGGRLASTGGGTSTGYEFGVMHSF